MLPYIGLAIAFTATLVGIYGDTVSANRRLTRNGWTAISIAVVGLAVSAVIQIRGDVAETATEKRNRELQGVALIQLQQALNEHIGFWRNLKEDGWDPIYFGDSLFETPNFLTQDQWLDQIHAATVDHLKLRWSYQSLQNKRRCPVPC